MKLAEPGAGASEYNFKRGPTYVWTRRGWRKVAGWFGVWCAVVSFARRMTRWWRPRMMCTAVNREEGTVTLAYQRWSWRRWRWE